MVTARLLPLPVLALALLAAQGADARPHRPGQRVDPACRRDARELCDDLQRGERLVDCLLDQRRDLSDRCRTALETPRLSRADLRDCREDTREFCRRQRGARLAACLVANQKDLSGECRDAVESAQREQGLLPERTHGKDKGGHGKDGAKGKPDMVPKKAPRGDDGAEDGDDGAAGDAEAGTGDTPER